MKNRAAIWFYILTVLGYAGGIILCCSLVFIPLGIYLIAGAITYYKLARLSDSELYYYSRLLKGWAIFFSIVLFPLGLISIIPYQIISSNNIKVNSVKPEEQKFDDKFETESNQENAGENESLKSEPEQIVVSEEEMAKFLEIKKYHDDGLITDAEFEKAKNSIFKK